jgi:hypothetical protein
MLHFAHVDRLRLDRVKVTRGHGNGGWLYDCRHSRFDDIEVDGFVGQPWLFGEPVGERNQIYDSRFGRLRARNVKNIDYAYLEGNAFLFCATRCSIKKISSLRCEAAVKVQYPSKNVTIRAISVRHGGNRHGNSGLKLQGLEPYRDLGVRGGPVRGVHVHELICIDQSGPGLYMENTVDCAIDSYFGSGNDRVATRADVWVGGTNDRIRRLRSVGSGAIGVLIRPYATGYRLGEVTVKNPGKRRPRALVAGVVVFGGSGTFGSVECVDTRRRPGMRYGVDVTSRSARGRIAHLAVRGAQDRGFKSVSRRFRQPSS